MNCNLIDAEWEFVVLCFGDNPVSLWGEHCASLASRQGTPSGEDKMAADREGAPPRRRGKVLSSIHFNNLSILSPTPPPTHTLTFPTPYYHSLTYPSRTHLHHATHPLVDPPTVYRITQG